MKVGNGVASRGAGGRWLALVGVLWGLLLSGTAEGTRFVMLSIEEMARRADAVIHGRVVSLETLRDSGGRVFTKVEVVLTEVWKGAVGGSTCTVVQGGGTLGDAEVRAVGQADYGVGDEVVVYLVRSAAGEWVTLGLSQGRFEVILEPDTGRRWVRNIFFGGAVEAGGGRRLAWPPERPLSLEELRRRTREVQP